MRGELGGERVAEMRRERGDSALPRHVIAEHRDGANDTRGVDVVRWSSSNRAREGEAVRARPPRPATDRHTEGYSVRPFAVDATAIARPRLLLVEERNGETVECAVAGLVDDAVHHAKMWIRREPFRHALAETRATLEHRCREHFDTVERQHVGPRCHEVSLVAIQTGQLRGAGTLVIRAVIPVSVGSARRMCISDAN